MTGHRTEGKALTLRYLADANVLSEPIRPVPDLRVVDQIQANLPRIATSATVWNEVLYGYYRMVESRRKSDLERYLFLTLAPTLTVLPYDDRAAVWHASERVRLERAGRTPPFADGQIAAVAFVNDLTLVTANLSDFSGFQGIRVENWNS